MDDDEWTPPTEAELKVLQAKRERSDKISQLMGKYLLKGYKMLDNYCPRCSCILLQEKNAPNHVFHCVSCIDLDSDVSKDDPAMSAAAAISTVGEGRHRDEASVEHSSINISSRDLGRSPVTAVHDIPGYDALPELNSPRPIPVHSMRQTQSNGDSWQNLPSNGETVATVTTLTTTIDLLTRQLDRLNEKLSTQELPQAETLDNVKRLCDCLASANAAIRSIPQFL